MDKNNDQFQALADQVSAGRISLFDAIAGITRPVEHTIDVQHEVVSSEQLRDPTWKSRKKFKGMRALR